MESIYLDSIHELLPIFSNSNKKVTLLAESGGTKTDWCWIDSQTCYFFTNESFRPETLETPSKTIFFNALQKLAETNSIELLFYGAGCYTSTNKQIVNSYFSSIKFHKITIESDILAAAKCTLNTNSGYVAILGTGSVVAKYDGNTITKLIGGYGYLLGDEGSGYYFGKLLIQKHLDKQLSVKLSSYIETTYGNREQILSKVYAPDGKNFISNLRIDSNKKSFSQELIDIHTINILSFIEKHLTKEEDITSLSFVGSYAYGNKELIHTLLKEIKCMRGSIIQHPLPTLVKQIVDKN
jgi:glucosamine kinase